MCAICGLQNLKESLEEKQDLFKEMLDYAGIKYDSTMTFSTLESLVSKYYPSYPYNMIDYACSNASMNYVKVYDTLEIIYENMAYSYKNKLKKEN